MKNLEKLIIHHLDEREKVITELIAESETPLLYDGLLDTLRELRSKDDEFESIINKVNEDDEGEDESYKEMLISDEIDYLIFNEYAKTFRDNLIKLGWEWDGEEWSNDEIQGQTCYGMVWNKWYDLDTDVREYMGDMFEKIMEKGDL